MSGHLGELLEAELAGVFRPERLAGREGETLAPDPYGLLFEASNVNLNAAAFRIPERVMLEAIKVEVGAELSVHSGEQVQVELGRDAFAVVVRGLEDRGVLF